MKSPLNIIFMGTPEFAVPALEALHRSPHHVVMVVTQPDRPVGRGKKILATPVKQAALGMGYPVFQTLSLKTPDSRDSLAKAAPDVIVVVAYGQILPAAILEIPALGCLNIHASLLPRYRGPAPIQWAIINRDAETGVTIMKLDTGLDTGDILLTQSTPIHPDDTAADLHDRLAVMGSALLLEAIADIGMTYKFASPQNHALATYAPMLKKSDGHIDWNQSAEDIDARVRGMAPWPGAYTFLDDKRLKIHEVRPVSLTATHPPGTIIPGPSDEIWVACGSHVLAILVVQPESGKRLSTGVFLKGHPIPPGTRLS